MSELVKVLNTGIRSCKSLQDLEDNFSANSSEYDAVCVATVGDLDQARAYKSVGTWVPL